MNRVARLVLRHTLVFLRESVTDIAATDLPDGKKVRSIWGVRVGSVVPLLTANDLLTDWGSYKSCGRTVAETLIVVRDEIDDAIRVLDSHD
jgi:hypothetical protein